MEITTDIAVQFVNRPRLFTRFFWPDMLLYEKQVGLMESVRDNVETFCHAGHKLGKDRTAALTALWFFCTRQPARVLITSTTHTQLHDTLWAEITDLVHRAEENGRPLPIDLQSMMAYKPKPSGGRYALDYIRGMVVQKGESLSGHHLDSSKGPKVLVILSEASGIEDEFYQSAQTQMHRMLITGNPLGESGFFHKGCTAGDTAHPMPGHKGLLRKVIHIDGELHSPNVIAGKAWYAAGNRGRPPTVVPGVLSYEEYLVRLEWPPDQRKTRLHGLFLDGADEKLFPADWLWKAQELGAKLREHLNLARREKLFTRLLRTRRAMGVDVGAGGDPSVWTIVGRYGVIHKVRKQTRNTAEIAGITLRLMDKYRIAPENVAFDSGGGGKQVADALRDRGYDVLDVPFGSSSNHPHEYKSMRAEMYGEASKALKPSVMTVAMLEKPCDDWLRSWTCMSLPPDDSLLREDLAVLPKLYDGEGRLRLPSKDRASRKHQGTGEKTVKEMLGRSPDDGDSFVLAVYAYQMMMDEERVLHRPAAY